MNGFAEFLKELDNEWDILADEGSECDGYETVAVEEVGSGRWTSHHEAITRDPSGKFWKWHYELGLTENQEPIGPCEYGDPVVVEVHPVEKTIVVTEWEVVE